MGVKQPYHLPSGGSGNYPPGGGKYPPGGGKYPPGGGGGNNYPHSGGGNYPYGLPPDDGGDNQIVDGGVTVIKVGF
jgi:hypothetical protein